MDLGGPPSPLSFAAGLWESMRFGLKVSGLDERATDERKALSAEEWLQLNLPGVSESQRQGRDGAEFVSGFHFPGREWRLGAFRGNDICLGMPDDAWQTQVAIGDLAFCARVLGKRLTGGIRHSGPNVAGRRHSSQENAIRRSSPFSVKSHKANSDRRIWNTGFIRRTRWRFVAAILLRRMTCVTVLCDESACYACRRGDLQGEAGD